MTEVPTFRLSHVAIPVTDFPETERFYARLGARRGFVRERAGALELVQMMLGAQFIELIATDRRGDRADAGHIALTTPEIESAWRLLADSGWQPLDRPRLGASGVMWFFVVDPSGNRVEITSPCAPPAGKEG